MIFLNQLMKQNFQKNLFLLLFLNLLIKPLWILGIDRVVQNQIGEESYGLYFSLMSMAMVLGILQDLGLSTFTNRHIAQNAHLFKGYFPKLLGLKIVLAISSFVVLYGIGLALGYGGEGKTLLFFVLLNQTLLSFILFVRSNLGALHLFKKDSIISVLDRALLIVVCGIFLYFPLYSDGFTLMQFVLAQTAGYGLTLLVGLIFLLSGKAKFSIKFSLPFSVSIFNAALPFALLFFLMYLYTRMDAIMVERLHPEGAFQAGVYAKGFRILDAVNMFSYLFSVILLPAVARLIKQKVNISDITEEFSRLLIFPLFVGTVCLALYHEKFMDLLYLGSSEYQNLVFVLIILNIVPMGLVYIFGTILTAGEKLKTLNTIAASGLMVNLILNFILIPIYGALGAAVATIFTQGITSIVQVYFAFKQFKLSFSSSFKFQSITFFVIFGLVVWLIYAASFHVEVKILATLLFGGIYLLASKTIKIQSVKTIAET